MNCIQLYVCMYIIFFETIFTITSVIITSVSQGDSKNIVPWSATDKIFKLTVDDDVEMLRQVIAEGADVNCSSENVRFYFFFSSSNSSCSSSGSCWSSSSSSGSGIV